MKKTILQLSGSAFCLLFISCSPNKITVPAFPAVVSFMPAITIGDTWVYSIIGDENGRSSNYTRTYVVTKVTRLDSTTTMFDVTIRDSGLHNYLFYYPSDTTYLIDSLIVKSDSVIDKTASTGFFLSKRTTSSWGLESRGKYEEYYGYCEWHNNLVEYTQVQNRNDYRSYDGYSMIFLENVGLISYNYGSFDPVGVSIHFSYSLVSFNGKTPEQISQEPR